MAIEEPMYTIKEQERNLEIRDYPALVAAEVTVCGERFAAATSGFRLLAAYIFLITHKEQPMLQKCLY